MGSRSIAGRARLGLTLCLVWLCACSSGGGGASDDARDGGQGGGGNTASAQLDGGGASGGNTSTNEDSGGSNDGSNGTNQSGGTGMDASSVSDGGSVDAGDAAQAMADGGAVPDAASTDASSSHDAGSPSEDAGNDTGSDAGPLPTSVDADEPVLDFGDTAEDDLFVEEQAARATLAATPIALKGKIVDGAGLPVVGASIALGESVVYSGEDGQFELTGLARKSRALEVRKAGYRTVSRAAHLFEPVGHDEVVLEPIMLTLDAPDTVRFLFGGDVAFGRRWLDDDGSTPRGEIPEDTPTALIQASDPAPGTLAAMRWVRPYFLQSDFKTFNFETPVTSNPSTPHPSKSFVFFTLPGSLDLMPWLGVSYVNLGNNHVYDYLQPGLADTTSELSARSIQFAGAGATSEAAFQAYRTTVKGHAYSFLGMTSVSGEDNPPLYVAVPDDPLTMIDEGKGGAADLRDTARFSAAIGAERTAQRIPIVQLHTGVEYSFAPTPYAREGMSQAVSAGAALVIAHHPHVAQGFGRENGVLIAHSLGNLCFDQDRLETMLTVMAQVDLRGEDLKRAAAIPLYLEDFRPRPIQGALSSHILRRIAEVSLSDGVLLVEQGGQGVLVNGEEEVTRSTRSLTLPIQIGASGFAVVDLRPELRAGESVVEVSTETAGLTGRLGEDVLVHGDFEDWDTDEDVMEVSRWDASGSSRFACVDQAYRGAVSMCSVRKSTNTAESVLSFRNRARVLGDALREPNKDLTLIGYIRGDNAGPLRIVSRYYASVGDQEFGEEDSFVHPGGTFDWRPFAADLHFPVDTIAPTAGDSYETGNPHAVRIFVRHGPPATGQGIARYDDFAVVSWREAESLQAGLFAQTPSVTDFVRVEGLPGDYAVTVVLERIGLAGL